MTRYLFARECRPMPLLEELLAAGVRAALVNPVAGGTEVECPPEQFDAAATVVASHDAQAIDAAEEVERDADDTDRARLREVVAALEAGTLTGPQVQRVLARVVRYLVRRGL